MPCAYRCYITNKGKCARLSISPIYTCKGSQDSVNANGIYTGQTENMRRLIFVFVWPANQKRDICTAFPASSLSSAAAA